MKNIQLIVVCIAVFLWALPAFGSEKIVVLATLDWEPYIGHELKNQGYVAEIIRESFKRSGYKVELKFLPWARSVRMAKYGNVDGYFPEYFSKKVTTYAQFSAPFPGGPIGFFKKNGNTIRYTTLTELKPYCIGVVRDYVNTAEFDAARYLKKEVVSNDITNIKKLLSGRIDLFIADKFVALYLLEKEMPGHKGQMEFIDPPLEFKDLYLCISNKAVDAKQKLAAFNKGLAQIRQDGTLQKIIKNRGF